MLLALFIRQEGRAPEPVLPMWLFRNKVIVAASMCTFVSGGLMFGINSYVPLFAQGVRGGSAMDAGLIVAADVGDVAAGQRRWPAAS